MTTTTINSGKLSGIFGFALVWFGQIVSMLATNMTGFALTIWVYERTGSATALGLMQVFFITPFLLISPLAGVWVDRYNRKFMMMVSDLTAGVGTCILLVLHALGALEIWHLYAVNVLLGLGNTFQWPAYSAAISTMVPKKQYSRANGMMSLMEAGPAVFSPLLAAAFLPIIGLLGILTLDVVTFLIAIGTLLIVTVPNPERTQAGMEGKGNIWQESIYGFRYIFKRPSLLGLQMVFMFGNLFAGIGFTLVAPLILSRTSNNSLALGSVMTAGAAGSVVGGVVMSVWKGFKRRVNGVLLGWILSSLTGAILLGIGRKLEVWTVAFFISAMLSIMVNPSNQAIWQAKVAPDLQGRVFSARRLIAWITQPIAPIIAGTLADFVFEPALASSGGQADIISGLVGSGPGSGMGLMMVLCGLGGAFVGLAGYFIPAIRNAEEWLPDHDELQEINGRMDAE